VEKVIGAPQYESNPEVRYKMDNWEIKGKPALIIIHMQRGVLDEDSKFAFLGLTTKVLKQSGTILCQQALLKGFREKKLPVIYIVATMPEQVISFPAYGKFWELMASLRPNPPGSKDIEVIPELSPQPDEPVISNWPISGFSNSNLQKLLNDYNAETVVLAGVATENAVLATTLQAVELGYSAIVPNDASASGNQRAHELVTRSIFPLWGLVVSTQEVLAHI
jgi:nicotinamidase-related amidase